MVWVIVSAVLGSFAAGLATAFVGEIFLPWFKGGSVVAFPSQEKQPPEAAPALEDLSMHVFVRSDLGMTKGTPASRFRFSGKIAAQCCHATTHMVARGIRSHDGTQGVSHGRSATFAEWRRKSDVRFFLVPDEAFLESLEATATDIGLHPFSVVDAGRTQIEAGSTTVLVMGPAPRAQLDHITDFFELKPVP